MFLLQIFNAARGIKFIVDQFKNKSDNTHIDTEFVNINGHFKHVDTIEKLIKEINLGQMRRGSKLQSENIFLDIYLNIDKKVEIYELDIEFYHSEFLVAKDTYQTIASIVGSESLSEKYLERIKAYFSRISQDIRMRWEYIKEAQKADEYLPKLATTIRTPIQDFIEILKTQRKYDDMTDFMSIKAQISNSVGFFIRKFEIGGDMIQLAFALECLNLNKSAYHAYSGIILDFKNFNFKDLGRAHDYEVLKEVFIFNDAVKAQQRIESKKDTDSLDLYGYEKRLNEILREQENKKTNPS